MVIVGRAQAPPHWETPPTAKIPPLHPPADPPPELPPAPPPPPRVLTDSWGVGRIRTGCSRPPGVLPSAHTASCFCRPDDDDDDEEEVCLVCWDLGFGLIHICMSPVPP